MSQQIGCSRFELFPDESRGSFDSGFTESGTKLTAFEHHAPGRIHFGKFHLFELKIGAHTDSKVYKIRNVNSSRRLPLNVFIFEQKYVGKGFAVMLVTKRWGGTAPDMDLRDPTRVTKQTSERVDPGFEIHGRFHRSSKTGVLHYSFNHYC